MKENKLKELYACADKLKGEGRYNEATILQMMADAHRLDLYPAVCGLKVLPNPEMAPTEGFRLT